MIEGNTMGVRIQSGLCRETLECMMIENQKVVGILELICVLIVGRGGAYLQWC